MKPVSVAPPAIPSSGGRQLGYCIKHTLGKVVRILALAHRDGNCCAARVHVDHRPTRAVPHSDLVRFWFARFRVRWPVSTPAGSTLRDRGPAPSSRLARTDARSCAAAAFAVAQAAHACSFACHIVAFRVHRFERAFQRVVLGARPAWRVIALSGCRCFRLCGTGLGLFSRAAVSPALDSRATPACRR